MMIFLQVWLMNNESFLNAVMNWMNFQANFTDEGRSRKRRSIQRSWNHWKVWRNWKFEKWNLAKSVVAKQAFTGNQPRTCSSCIRMESCYYNRKLCLGDRKNMEEFYLKKSNLAQLKLYWTPIAYRKLSITRLSLKSRRAVCDHGDR